jgi:hypothetical protein
MTVGGLFKMTGHLGNLLQTQFQVVGFLHFILKDWLMGGLRPRQLLTGLFICIRFREQTRRVAGREGRWKFVR